MLSASSSPHASMDQMTSVAKTLEPLKASDTNAVQAAVLFDLYEQFREKSKGADDKGDGNSSVDALVHATINLAGEYIDFGPTVKAVTDVLGKIVSAAEVKAVPPPISSETENSLNAMKNIFSGWDGKSSFSTTVGDSDYVGGPNGEMFVHNNKTGVDTLTTSSSDDATIITKSKDGKVEAFTNQFAVTMQEMGDGKSLMTITTNSQPPSSISLVISADNKGFDIVDPKDPSKVRLHLQSLEDVQKFDFLVKEFVGARGMYSFDSLLSDFNGYTLDQLHAKFSALQAQSTDPLELILGNGIKPPIAKVNGDDPVPILFDLLHGQASVGEGGDFVFSDVAGVATTGTGIFLAALSRGIREIRENEHDAELINNVVNAALAIAQMFMSSDSLASTSAVGMLLDLYGVLSAINSIPANLALAPISAAINQVESVQARINRNPDCRSIDVKHGIVSDEAAA